MEEGEVDVRRANNGLIWGAVVGRRGAVVRRKGTVVGKGGPTVGRGDANS